MSRNISDLHPILQEKVEELKKACEKKGLKIGISECLRTVAEQDALYAQGRTAPGSIVTNAKGSTYSSMHQWGVAFDFYRNDGKGAYNDSDGFFTKVGKIGQSLGLEWGGSWTSPVDKPHFQLPDWGSTPTKLKNTYGTFEKFKKTWPAGSTAAVPAGVSSNTTTSSNKTSANSSYVTYKVKKGDTLSKIAKANNTTIDVLVKLNAIKNPNVINIGDVLKIAEKKKEKTSYYKKCAASCDTITKGLQNIGVDSSYAHREKIAKANNINSYSGTAEQNIKMLKLLKDGKLIKA